MKGFYLILWISAVSFSGIKAQSENAAPSGNTGPRIIQMAPIAMQPYHGGQKTIRPQLVQVVGKKNEGSRSIQSIQATLIPYTGNRPPHQGKAQVVETNQTPAKGPEIKTLRVPLTPVVAGQTIPSKKRIIQQP